VRRSCAIRIEPPVVTKKKHSTWGVHGAAAWGGCSVGLQPGVHGVEEAAAHGRHGTPQERGEGAPLLPPVAHEGARGEAGEHRLEAQHALEAAAAHGALHEGLEREGVAPEQEQRELAHREPPREGREGHAQQEQAADAEHGGVREREEELHQRAAHEVRERGERVGLTLVEHGLA